jgi:N-acetylglucosaminyldiphosphoundecaprenol N-acetyl-beta-D-mannosaminyltransferase
VTFAEALDRVEALVAAGRGGAVFTPNVDHVVRAERDPAFRKAYDRADLKLADGAPLVWVSRLLGPRLPERVAGADLAWPLLERAAARRWRVALVGGAPGAAERVAALARERLGLEALTECPRLEPCGRGAEGDEAAARVAAARPHLVLAAFGAPKQELWIDRHREQLAPAVLAGVGASLDFIAGHVRRAPRWVSRMGMEWFWRLASEPRRLWRRYLVDDPAFLGIVWRSWRRRRAAV